MAHLYNGHLKDNIRTAELLEQCLRTPQTKKVVWNNTQITGNSISSYKSQQLNNSSVSSYSPFSSGSKGNCGILCV